VLDLRVVSYDHPDPVALTELAQSFYVQIYGGPDDTPFTVEEFAPPNGAFLVGYLDGRPAAMGGWRFSEAARVMLGYPDRVVELKRMYVVPASRRRGHARAVLTHLERTAAAAGAGRMVLETGEPQPEAITLYRSSGYLTIPAFGHYADSPHSVHLGKRLDNAAAAR